MDKVKEFLKKIIADYDREISNAKLYLNSIETKRQNALDALDGIKKFIDVE